ncbi:MAG: hypothetical protein P1S46_11590 [bacterium]|nr:hypothetical protein [bacterium]MDT8367439.1 hypothetical protein [bacterium]
MSRSLAIALLVGAAFCWSLGGALIKWVPLNAMAIAGIRSALAAVVVYAAFPSMRFTWSRCQLSGAAAFAATMINIPGQRTDRPGVPSFHEPGLDVPRHRRGAGPHGGDGGCHYPGSHHFPGGGALAAVED